MVLTSLCLLSFLLFCPPSSLSSSPLSFSWSVFRFFTLTLPLMSPKNLVLSSSSLHSARWIYWSSSVSPLSPSRQLCAEAPFSPMREGRMNRRAYSENSEEANPCLWSLTPLSLLSSPPVLSSVLRHCCDQSRLIFLLLYPECLRQGFVIEKDVFPREKVRKRL